jgi:hypothetical protein
LRAEWQITNYAEPAITSGYDAIAADNFALGNAVAACGIWRDGEWIQMYTGKWDDVNYTKYDRKGEGGREEREREGGRERGEGARGREGESEREGAREKETQWWPAAFGATSSGFKCTLTNGMT